MKIPILVAAPMHPLLLARQLEALFGEHPPAWEVPDGATRRPCVDCGIVVGLGPEQQTIVAAVEARGARPIVYCLLCIMKHGGKVGDITFLFHNNGEPPTQH